MIKTHREYRKPARRRFKKKTAHLKIRPGSDARLQKVFATIGVPEQTPFTPDPFQTAAVKAIQEGDCLVSVPTGSGKTWIARKAIEQVLAKQGQAWYATPLKALSNAKYEEFSDIFGPLNVGILTGDRKQNPGAPIIVGTTEILRNQLYDAMHHGRTLAADCVVLDEAHFLGDEDRGVVWEEIMIYLPCRIPLLLLSATIGNAHQIAGWLESIRGTTCSVIVETKRPVPLYPLFFHPSGTLYPLLTDTDENGEKKIYKKVTAHIIKKYPPQLAPPYRLPPFGDILRVLRKYNLLPAIFFLKSRADCDGAIELCSGNHSSNPDIAEKRNARIAQLTAESPHVTHHLQRSLLERQAVAAHHSGQLPAWKLIIETLMSEGLLDVVFATSTVAAGVNFPARTIAFLNSDRFNGREFMPLSATELHQMTGRAGRRGMDNIGFAMVLPGKFMDIRLVARLFSSPSTPVTSQIRVNFSMVLNLLLSHPPEQVEELLDQSFATYLLSHKPGKKRSGQIRPQSSQKLRQDFSRHLNFLKKTGFITPDGTLTTDGQWASQLRVDQPLIIAEGFRQGVFPKSDPAVMAGIVAAFVNEREEQDRTEITISPEKLKKHFFKVQKKLRPFAESMQQSGFAVRPLFLRPAVTLYLWAAGQSWENVLEFSLLAEGDLAMLILRTADHLRHISALHSVFPEAAATATQATELILKDPVVTYDSA